MSTADMFKLWIIKELAGPAFGAAVILVGILVYAGVGCLMEKVAKQKLEESEDV